MCPVGVEAVCAYPKQLGKVAAGNSEALLPHPWAHSTRRRLYRLTPPVAGLWLPYTHADCVCNELVGINNRVLADTVAPTAAGLKMIKDMFRELRSKFYPVSPITVQQALDSFTGRRYKRYKLAADSLERVKLSAYDARVQAFIKAEKLNPGAKTNPDPRIIQFRSGRYCLTLGTFIKPIEKQLYTMKSVMGTRIVAKGLNQQARAKLIIKKWLGFKDPVCYSLDCSRFDQHVKLPVIKLFQKFMLSICPDPVFRELLRQQHRNKCYTRNGVKYTVLGNVLSGEMSTSMGDCFIMINHIYAAMKLMGFTKWDLLDDGDDCLLFIEKCQEPALDGLKGVFAQFGHELKLENRASSIHEINFCQTKLVLVDGVPTMIRNWRKVLSQSACGTRHWGDSKLVRGMLNAVGLCELAMGRGVPIMQQFAMQLIRNGDGSIPKAFADDEYEYIKMQQELKGRPISSLKPRDVSWSTRVSFHEAFGIDPLDQIDIEQQIRTWLIDSTVSVMRPAELDHSWRQDVSVGDAYWAQN